MGLKIIETETLEAIAEKTRAMAGLSRKLSTAQIIYWLGRVKFIEQAWVLSDLKYSTNTKLSGYAVPVPKGTVKSDLSFEILTTLKGE